MTSTTATARAPVYIFGITQRTGTHLLAEALAAHPSCTRVTEPPKEWQPRWEHALNRRLDLLDSYVEAVASKWQEVYRTDANRAAFRRAIGRGIGEFLGEMAEDSSRRVVVKEPSAARLRTFLQFVPEARPIVLVRDGRAVVESGVKGFGWSYERGMRIWRNRARELLTVLEEPHVSERVFVLRYEDLVGDQGGSLRKVFDFLGLDPEIYDYESVARIPVRGSSFARKDNKVTWMPVQAEAPAAQSPSWSSWPAARQFRFWHLAGREMLALGYPEQRPPGSANPLRHVWNGGLSAGWACARTARRTRDVLKTLRPTWAATRSTL
jgi:hypothetical protein